MFCATSAAINSRPDTVIRKPTIRFLPKCSIIALSCQFVIIRVQLAGTQRECCMPVDFSPQENAADMILDSRHWPGNTTTNNRDSIKLMTEPRTQSITVFAGCASSTEASSVCYYKRSNVLYINLARRAIV